MIEKHNSKSGQTIIEFAGILVLVVILLLGIIEFSIVMYDKALLTRGSREGARAAVVYRASPSVDPNHPGRLDYAPMAEANIESAINTYLQGRLVTFGVPFNASVDDAVNVTWRDANGDTVSASSARTGTIEVEVNFAYTFLALPRFGALGNGMLNLQAMTIMRVE